MTRTISYEMRSQLHSEDIIKQSNKTVRNVLVEHGLLRAFPRGYILLTETDYIPLYYLTRDGTTGYQGSKLMFWDDQNTHSCLVLMHDMYHTDTRFATLKVTLPEPRDEEDPSCFSDSKVVQHLQVPGRRWVRDEPCRQESYSM